MGPPFPERHSEMRERMAITFESRSTKPLAFQVDDGMKICAIVKRTCRGCVYTVSVLSR